MEKNFYYQPNGCDVQWYEEIKKLTTGHDKDYRSECFVVTQKSTTNWEQLIWIDKEILNTDPKTIQ